jgi:hypothetical protein
MSKENEPKIDLEGLAKRYVDLWQQQMGATLGDPALAQTLAKSFAALSQGLNQGMARAAKGDPQHGQSASEGAAKPAPAAKTPPGTHTAAPASGDPDGELARLKRRLSALEKRIAALEAKPETRGGSAKTRSARRKS